MDKKDVNMLFDVPMVSFFGTELCDLVGLYILHRHKSIYNATRSDYTEIMDLQL